MNLTRLKILASFVAVAMLPGLLPVLAQQMRASPHETVSAWIDGKSALVAITYGRPYSKAPFEPKKAGDPKKGEIRKIWGGQVPWGKAWRAGADEATTLITSKDLDVNGTQIPAGAYTLYMVPEENGTSKLAFSKKIGFWGIPVDEKQDLARVDMKREALDNDVDQLTISVEPAQPSGGVIKLKWEKTQYSVNFNVKK